MRRWLLLLAFPVLLVLTVQGLNHVRDGMVALDGKFIGLDGYTHLLRAKQFVETGDWFDHSVPRGNPPAGDVLYWPRPFDALLLGGAVLLLPFTDFDSALHFWAVFIGPVLHLLSLIVLMWAVRPLFDDTGLVYLGILFAFQLFIVHIASVARPDHHAFLALLFVWLLGAGLRALRTGATSRDMLQAALPATLSLWISLESLVAIAALLAAFGTTWIAVRADFARRIAVFSAGLTAGFALSLPLEHGFAGYTIVVYDAPSVVHLVLLALTGLAAGLLALADARFGFCRRIGGRIVVALAAALFVVVAMRLLLPRFYEGPLADVDPEVVRQWFNFIAEFAPLLDLGDLQGSISRFLFHLGPALLAIPFLLWRGRAESGERRRMWLLLAGFALVYVALAISQQRWTGFAQYVVVIGWAGLLTTLLTRLSVTRSLGLTAVRAMLVVVFIFGFLFLGSLLPRTPLVTAGSGPGCPLTEMSRWLGREPALNDRPRRILSFINFGPELLYRTQHEVIATPNHRNPGGIMAAIRALGRLPPAEARAILSRRGVDLVLVCLGTEEANDYRQGNAGDTLFARIEAGTPPAWLRPIALPGPLAPGFRLLEVVADRDEAG